MAGQSQDRLFQAVSGQGLAALASANKSGALLDEARGATDPFERPNGAIHAAGEDPTGAFHEYAAERVAHADPKWR